MNYTFVSIKHQRECAKNSVQINSFSKKKKSILVFVVIRSAGHTNMIDTLSMSQPEKWLYQIRQKGDDSTCYVMVPNANVREIFKRLLSSYKLICLRLDFKIHKIVLFTECFN